MHVFDWIHWGDMQLMRDELRWLPDVHADGLHHRLQLQRSCIIRVWDACERLHMHVLDWIHWGDMQLMRDVLHWIPDVHSDALHHS